MLTLISCRSRLSTENWKVKHCAHWFWPKDCVFMSLTSIICISSTINNSLVVRYVDLNTVKIRILLCWNSRFWAPTKGSRNSYLLQSCQFLRTRTESGWKDIGRESWNIVHFTVLDGINLETCLQDWKIPPIKNIF